MAQPVVLLDGTPGAVGGAGVGGAAVGREAVGSSYIRAWEKSNHKKLITK